MLLEGQNLFLRGEPGMVSIFLAKPMASFERRAFLFMSWSFLSNS